MERRYPRAMMSAIMRALWACCILGVSAAPSQAAMTAEDFLAAYGSSAAEVQLVYEAYINGISSGLQSANVALEQRNQSPLYCTPPDMTFTAKHLADILRRFVKLEGIFAMEPLDGALLAAMIDAFPCTDAP